MPHPQDKIKDEIKSIFQEEIAGEVWYENRSCEERLEKCLIKAEKRILDFLRQREKENNQFYYNRGYLDAKNEEKAILERILGVIEKWGNENKFPFEICAKIENLREIINQELGK